MNRGKIIALECTALADTTLPKGLRSTLPMINHMEIRAPRYDVMRRVRAICSLFLQNLSVVMRKHQTNPGGVLLSTLFKNVKVIKTRKN